MPRPYSMDKRSEENELRRRRLIEAAQEVAAEEGLSGLTLQAVADRADVALRTVYNHFSSRDELVAAALADLAVAARQASADIDVTGVDARAQLRGFIGQCAATYLAQGRGLDALMGAIELPDVREVIDEVRSWRRRRITQMVRQAKREGTLSIPERDAVEIVYLATAHSALKTLTGDAGLGPAAAQALLATIVDRSLFGGVAPPTGFEPVLPP
jgi:AcrR family transcriptional regulator